MASAGDSRPSFISKFLTPYSAVVAALTGLLLVRDIDGRWLSIILASILAAFLLIYVGRLRGAKPLPPKNLEKGPAPFLVGLGLTAVGVLLCATGITLSLNAATDLHIRLAIVLTGIDAGPFGLGLGLVQMVRRESKP